MSAYFGYTQYKQKGVIQTPVILITLALAAVLLFLLSQGKLQLSTKTNPQPANQQTTYTNSTQSAFPDTDGSITSSSAKGVIIVKTPGKNEEIKSPLTVSGLVYGNNGTLTIKLKQKTSGQYVTEDKVVKIFGKSDNISYAEAIQFGLPAMPQPGILELEYKDASGKGLDDKVSIDVNFPSDLGAGR